MSMQRTITYGGKPVQCADAMQYPLAAGKANGYECPIGPAHGRGAVLMLRKDIPIEMTEGPKALVFASTGEDHKARTTFKRLYVSRITQVVKGAPLDPNALLLVELVDRRYHLNRWTSVNRQFNVQAPCDTGYLTESKNSGSPWTWTTLIGRLWQDCGLGSAPTLPGSGLSEEPNNLKFVGVNAWQALHQVLHNLRMTTVYNPFTDAFSVIKFDEEQNIGINNPLEFYGGPILGLGCRGPATIRVFFHRAEGDTGQENDTGTTGNFTSDPAYTVDIATGLPNAVAGSVLALWDDSSAVIEHGESALTAGQISDLQAKAQLRADAWLELNARKNGLRYSEIYTGLVAKLPGARFKRILWRDYGIEYGGLVTELCREPGIPHADECASCGEAGDGNFGPPDLTEHGAPTYPDRAQVVKLVDTERLDTTNNLYDGKVSRYISGATGGTYTDYEECFIKFLESSPTISSGDRFVGRLMGLVTSASEDGGTRPLYLVRAGGSGGGGSTGLMLFAVGATALTRDTEELTDAECVWAIGGGSLPAPEDMVTVKNPPSVETDKYWYAAETGYHGMAINVDGNWWILRMEPRRQTVVADMEWDAPDLIEHKMDVWVDIKENPQDENTLTGDPSCPEP